MHHCETESATPASLGLSCFRRDHPQGHVRPNTHKSATRSGDNDSKAFARKSVIFGGVFAWAGCYRYDLPSLSHMRGYIQPARTLTTHSRGRYEYLRNLYSLLLRADDFLGFRGQNS